MANNGVRQGGGAGGANQGMNEHVEFTVKAEEDLYLTGSENTIRRVTAETNYSCLMLKTQRFSSLFRHYAKYHGLRKDDLEYYFVNPLGNEDTPETVQLQRADTIMVRKRRRPEAPEAGSNDDEFFKDMKDFLEDEEHMDVVFLVHADPSTKKSVNTFLPKSKKRSPNIGSSEQPHSMTVKTEEYSENKTMIMDTHSFGDDKTDIVSGSLIHIRAHKCVLTARADYFKALFRKSCGTMGNTNMAFQESSNCIIHVDPIFSAHIVRLMMEFIYTNRICSLPEVMTDDLLSLVHLSDTWLLRDLKRLVEHQLIRSHIDVNRVARLYCATEEFNANRLQRACINFIMENIREVTGNVAFQEEMKHYTNLCIPILKAAADLIPEPVHKKQRIGDSNTGSISISTPNTAIAVSSPVPDSDS